MIMIEGYDKKGEHVKKEVKTTGQAQRLIKKLERWWYGESDGNIMKITNELMEYKSMEKRIAAKERENV